MKQLTPGMNMVPVAPPPIGGPVSQMVGSHMRMPPPMGGPPMMVMPPHMVGQRPPLRAPISPVSLEPDYAKIECKILAFLKQFSLAYFTTNFITLTYYNFLIYFTICHNYSRLHTTHLKFYISLDVSNVYFNITRPFILIHDVNVA